MGTTLIRFLPRALAWRLEGIMRSPPRLIAAMLFAATLLAFTMALVAAFNDRPELWRGPPDEYSHRSAARFYLDHWLPPKVGEAASLDSYSRDYGFSYLNDSDLVYFFAGKFAALVSPVVSNNDVGFRLFNVLLLGVLAGFCWRRPAAWLVFAPLLVSPQIWYIFSYFNGDAFPLFLSMLIAYQLAEPGSLFNKYLDSPGVLRGFSGALLFGVLVALLALSKKNYYAFLVLLPAVIALVRLGIPSAVLLASAAIGGAAWYLGWYSMGTREFGVLVAAALLAIMASIFLDPSTWRARGAILAKLAIMGVIALTVLIPRIAWDVVAHGSLEEKRVAIGLMQEELAKPEYKPSQIYSDKFTGTFHGLELRTRGTSLSDLFSPPWNWHIQTFLSATGLYGWRDLRSPKAYYLVMVVAYLALFAAYLGAVARSKDVVARVNFILVWAFAILTIAVSIYHSWYHDFQAQGRYLFPIVPMSGVGFASARREMGSGLALGAISACFALSAWSFVFTGLLHIPRSF
jgi:hypothetical protein